jgi:Sulfotransferase domain
MSWSKRRQIERLDFIVAGAQKSGTTALHYFLSKHPEIVLPDKEEMHFFDDEQIFSKPVDYELLHRHFPPVLKSATAKKSELARPFGVAGECTPIYIYWKPAIERIWNYNPKIKLVVLLRNPADRAFAHWNMQRFKDREPLDFLEAVKQEKSRITPPLSVQTRRYSYVDRGFYSDQLERVFKLFPREQVMVIRFEEFQKQKQQTLDSIFRFLGVEPLRRIRDKDRNVVPYAREMTAEERRYLHAIFGWDIAKLEELVGWDCSDWKL